MDTAPNIDQNLRRFNKLWIDYDEEADVLYLSFQRPQKATESEMRDDGVLLRYKRDKLNLLNYLIFSDVWQRENLSP